MKKHLIGLGLVFAMIFTSQCLAGDDLDGVKMSKKEKKELKQEQEKLEKQRKKEEKLRKREMRKLEKQQAKERATMKRAQRKEKAEKQKNDAKIAEEERKLNREFEKEHSQKVAKLNKISKEEERRMKELAKEKRAREKKERRHLEMQKREEEKHLSNLHEKTSQAEKQAKKEAKKAEAARLTSNWKDARKAVVANEYKEGKFSDVHMLPAWPFSNWFFNEKAMVNVTASYYYATDAYDSDGASRDITTLNFGEETIHLQDILLASKLLHQNPAPVAIRRTPPSFLDNFINLGYDQIINFNGKSEKYGLDFDFARHVLRDDITIGVQVPVLYMRNHLDACMNFPTSSLLITTDEENASLVYREALHRVLQSKGINELGGSATGLGDITLFGNVEVTTKYVDKIVLGLKVGLPTGKEESMSKLFAPSLSANDKCAEFAAFASMLVNYNTYVNPHLSLQASFFSTSHVNKRVPHKVSSPENAVVGEAVSNDIMAMGDRVEYVDDGTDTAISFEGYDSTIRGLADHAVSLKYEKGPEFHVRLGNVFNKFICRRGFFDIYYDLRAKLEDNYRGLDVKEYDIQKMEENTKSVEHRIGMEYSHQYDSRTRLKATLNYSFAGTNAPKAFDIGCSLGHSF